MQRSKAVNVEVKQVIGALCRLLTAVGLDAVPAPEAFRRAKFGSGAEEDQFWGLLTNILQTAAIVSPEVSTQLRGECRKLVAAGLWQTGYHADWMYGRDGGGGGGGDGGSSFSSRDLLLALGWLLATGTLEKLLTRRVQQLDRTLLTSVPVNSELSGDLQLDSGSLRRLQWLSGCLRHQRRTLLSLTRARTGALHTLLSASLSSSASSSSGQRSSVLQEDCICLQQLCDLLGAYLKWRQVEKVFWTWMDSVVDLTDPHVRRSSHTTGRSPGVCHHGNSGLEKLEEMLTRLPGAEEAQRSDRGRVGHRGGADSLGASSLPPASLLPSSPSVPPVCRASLQTKEQAGRRSGPAEGSAGGADSPQEVPASEAAALLRGAESLLLQRRDRRRLVSRMQLQEMIGRLDQLVLIPL